MKLCFLDSSSGNIDDQYILKASAHSFKRFTSQLFKVIFLSFYAPITSDECHAWFHLNAARPAARNTEQVNITKNLVQGRIRTTNFARLPDYKSTIITSRPQLAWYEMELNVNEIFIYTIYKEFWKGACIYRITNVSVVFYFSIMTYKYC